MCYRLQGATAKSERAVDLARQAAHRERAALFETGAALRKALFGDAPGARRSAQSALELSNAREVEYGVALALTMSGDTLRSRILADDLERRFPENTVVKFNYAPTLRARLAVASQVPAKALDVLQVAGPYELGFPPSAGIGLFGALYPVYVRGEAYLAAGRGVEAAAEFRKVLDHRGIVMSDGVRKAVGVLERPDRRPGTTATWSR